MLPMGTLFHPAYPVLRRIMLNHSIGTASAAWKIYVPHSDMALGLQFWSILIRFEGFPMRPDNNRPS
jgi:hypothetical protein